MSEIAWRNNVLNVLERSEKQLQLIASLLKQPAPSPIPPFFGQTRLNAPTPVSVTTEPSFSYADGTPAKALIDYDRHVQADVLTMPPVSVELVEKGFSNAADTPTRALVDSDRHVQVDVLSGTVSVSSLPPVTQASIKRVLQYPEGTDIDPRQIRALTASDIVTLANQIARDADGHGQVDILTMPSLPAGANTIGNVGVNNFPAEYPLPSSQVADLKNVSATKSGTWNIDNLLNPHPVAVSRQGSITSVSVSLTAAGTSTVYTPTTGKAAKVIGFYIYCDADVIWEMRFTTSGKVIAGLPFKGAVAMNGVGMEMPTGSADETIQVYAGGAANIKGWINVVEV